jgi:N6-adenosine-specific RNA methylase IME4
MGRPRIYRNHAARQAAYRQRKDAPALPEVVLKLDALVSQGGQFRTIYADPPWPYDNQATRGSTHRHYQDMSLDVLKALPVPALAAPDCHLYLWATTPLLPEALDLLAAWGFTYRSKLVWDKELMGTGNYWRVQTEDLLLGVKGRDGLFRLTDWRNLLHCRRGPYSEKPDEVRWRIQQARPGPYLELFGRRHVPGWTVMGDQIGEDLFFPSAYRDA